MSLLKDFRQFALRGNVVDMAVGIIIGVSFGKIITSLVNDVLMPPIGLLLGGIDFSNLSVDISHNPIDKVAIRYGLFFNSVIDFFIVALVVFLLVKGMQSLRPKESIAPTTKNCPECLSSIPLAAKRCAHCSSVVG